MQINFSKLSYLFENGWRYATMKIFARLPLIKLNLAALVRLISMQKAEDIRESSFFRADSTLDNITQELKINGFSVNISCKEKTLADLNEAAQLNKLYAYQKKELAFDIGNKADFERNINQDILIAHYANLNNIEVFKEIEKDPILMGIAKRYLGKNAKCIASQMWWTFKADVSNDVKSKAAHFYHRDLDAFQFMKFFIYLTDVDADDGAHFFVKGSHRPNLTHSFREKFRISRVGDGKIREWYGETNIIEMTGKAGSVIAEDTFGFHKGQSPTNNARLLACFVFANQDYGVQRFTV